MTGETIGFIGLGAMGLPMAGNLLRAGFSLRVHDSLPARADPLVARGAVAAGSPAGAVAPGGTVVTMVPDDAALEAITAGDHGLLAALAPGGVHLCMSTVSPGAARRLAALHAEHGCRYLAGPVFGKPDVAQAGRLWVLLGGDPAAKTRVLPLLGALAQKVFDFGPDPAAANVVKLAGNFLIGSAVEAMAEAFTLAERHGVPRQQVYELFTTTIFDGFVYRAFGKQVAEENYQPVGARPSLVRKDFGLILAAAAAVGLPMPLAELVRDRLDSTLAKGRDDTDWAGFAREVSEAQAPPPDGPVP